MKHLSLLRLVAAFAACLALTTVLSAADAGAWKGHFEDARKAADEGRHADADRALALALTAADQFGEGDLRLVQTLHLAASTHQRRRQFAEAEPHLRRVLAMRERALGANHEFVAESAFNLGRNLTEQKKFADAEALLKRAETIAKWKVGSYHPAVATCQAALARCHALAGRFADADKLYTAALRVLGTPRTTTTFTERPNEVQDNVFIPNYRRVMQIRLEHAQTLHAAKRTKDAEEAFKKLVKLIEDVESRDSLLLAKPLLEFSLHYSDQQKLAQAEPLLLRRQAILTKHLGDNHAEHLVTKAALEKIYRGQGKVVEADELALQLSQAGAKPGGEK
jgi:tetratricopeptide (TPR) repeat protein